MRGPPSSPGRLWRPLAQRAVRNAFSSLAAARARWEAAASKGLASATALVNAALSNRYVDSMDLGALKHMPDIRQLAKAKLRRQLRAHVLQLRAALADLGAAVRAAEAAAAELAALPRHLAGGGEPGPSGGGESPLRAGLPPAGAATVDGATAGAREEGGGSGAAPAAGGGLPGLPPFCVDGAATPAGALDVVAFASLPLGVFLALGDEMCAMWRKELATKRRVVLALELLGGGDVAAADAPGAATWRRSEGGSVGGPEGEPPGREALEVLLTAWMLEVHIDKARLDEIRDIVQDEISASAR